MIKFLCYNLGSLSAQTWFLVITENNIDDRFYHIKNWTIMDLPPSPPLFRGAINKWKWIEANGPHPPTFKNNATGLLVLRFFLRASKMTSWERWQIIGYFNIFLIWQKSCTLLKPLNVSTWFGKTRERSILKSLIYFDIWP